MLTTPTSADDWSNQNGGRMLLLMPTPLGTTRVADERPPVAAAATASVYYTGASHKTAATVADAFSECNTRAVVVEPHALALLIASHTVSHRRRYIVHRACEYHLSGTYIVVGPLSPPRTIRDSARKTAKE